MELDETRVRRLAREEAKQVIEPVVRDVTSVTIALWGPERPDIEGGGRFTEQGVVQMVHELHEGWKNQGLKGQMPAQISVQSFDRRTKITGALIAGGFSLLVAAVTAIATVIVG